MTHWRSIALAMLASLMTLGLAATAFAQDGGLPSADSLGTDGEIRQQESTLVIEKPADGDDVKTPFTVAGRAPAGAQLELWLGNALERVFKADDAGRFTAAISQEIDPNTKIWVHQIGARGRRVQSTSVTVNWGGQADKRDAQLVGQPPVGETAVGADPEIEPEPEPDRAPAPPPLGSGGLPSAEELGGGDLTVAPVPPPVDEAGGVDPFETADQIDPFNDAEVRRDTERNLFAPAPPSRGLRILAEAGAGTGLAVAGGLVLGLVGAAIDISSVGFPAGFAAVGVLVGFYGGLPAGVVIAGDAMQGNGSILAVVGAELLGVAAGFLLTVATVGAAAPTLLVLPLAGAITGYELTSDLSRFSGNAVQSVRPIVAPTADGTGTVYGLRLQF